MVLVYLLYVGGIDPQNHLIRTNNRKSVRLLHSIYYMNHETESEIVVYLLYLETGIDKRFV